MNSLIQNYEIILKALTATYADIPRFHQTGKSELSGLKLTALNLTAEFTMKAQSKGACTISPAQETL